MCMDSYQFHYGRGSLDASALRPLHPRVLESKLAQYVPEATEEELVERAVMHPMGSKPLAELAAGKRHVVVIASDHTRPVPSKIIMPVLLREIRRGNPAAEITILIATGCHRGTTREELAAKFGQEFVERERIVVHDCDESEMVCMGTLPSGGQLILNRMVVDADLLVAEGFIEPHFFAGFSGGRKSVLPGVADRKTVLYNHNGRFIDDPCARTGILEGNPLHRDMVFAARQVGLDFICNVVINDRHQVIFASACDMEEAHAAGCAFLKDHCSVRSPMADLAVTTNGGYPLDQNLYQAVKGMTGAEPLVKEGGVIIMIAKCEDGVGGDSFYRTFAEEKDLERMLRTFLHTPPEETKVDQWQSQIFARVLRRASVILISELPDDVAENFQLIPAHSLEEAVAKARGIIGREQWDTVVIPDGVSVISSAADN